jgi:hypothetical protein
MVAQLTPSLRAILASAYELTEQQVEQDAQDVQHWDGTDSDLLSAIEACHQWTLASENGPYYLAAVRQALR